MKKVQNILYDQRFFHQLLFYQNSTSSELFLYLMLKEIIFSNNIFSSDTDILEFSSLSDNANLLGAAFIPLGEFYKTYNENM